MKISRVLTLILFLCLALPALADQTVRKNRPEPLCDSIEGTACTTATPVTIAGGASGYVYPYMADIARAGIFSSQVNIGSTTDTISVTIELEVLLDNTEYSHWSPAQNTAAADDTYTTTGVQDATRHTATVNGDWVRIKLTNNTGTGEAVTINWGVIAIW